MAGAPPRAWGGTRSQLPSGTKPAEHPHVRGEDFDTDALAAAFPGAPPRAWGGLLMVGWCGCRARSTPTCVGRAHTRRRASSPGSEHPHVRGEDERGASTWLDQHGAPPRAWGGHRGYGCREGTHRSTPTCVGRTWAPTLGTPRPTEHPHVRGEDTRNAFGALASSGAPPRAWGGHARVVGLRVAGRSTPTCVGGTRSYGPPNCGFPEHPHVRGEDVDLWAVRPGRCGAPPRAWGGHGRPVTRGPDDRSTPTCVGRTDCLPRAAHAASEHPHVRGEDVGHRLFL